MNDTITASSLPAVGASVTFRTAGKGGVSEPRKGTVKSVEDRGPGRGNGVRIIVATAEGAEFKLRPSQVEVA